MTVRVERVPARGAGGAAADGEDAAEALLGQGLLVEHLDLEARGPALVGEQSGVGLGVEVGGGGVDQVTGEDDGLGGDAGGLELILVAADEHELLDTAVVLLLLTADTAVVVRTEDESLDGGGEAEDTEGGGDGADLLQCAGGAAGGAAEDLIGEFLRITQADGDHGAVLEGDAGDLVGLARGPDGGEGVEDLAGGGVVEKRGGRQLRAVLPAEDGHEQRVGRLRGLLRQFDGGGGAAGGKGESGVRHEKFLLRLTSDEPSL